MEGNKGAWWARTIRRLGMGGELAMERRGRGAANGHRLAQHPQSPPSLYPSLSRHETVSPLPYSLPLPDVPPSLPQICRSFPPSDINSPLPFPSSLSHALIPSSLPPPAPCPQPERRVRSLPGGAEGGRAPLVHLRPAQRQRGDQEEAGGVLPQGVNKGVGKRGGESERQAATPGSLARAIG